MPRCRAVSAVAPRVLYVIVVVIECHSTVPQLKESHLAMAGPAFRAAAVRVRVPATSANLGPGFDALGLALGLYDDVVVRVADSGLHIDIAGEGSETLPRDEKHLLVRSLRTAFDLLGGQPRGLEIVCANRIPHGRGLGSSSAAICDGIPAVISGAGPTVMALADADTADKVEALAGTDWAANRLGLDQQGATVLPLATASDT